MIGVGSAVTVDVDVSVGGRVSWNVCVAAFGVRDGVDDRPLIGAVESSAFGVAVNVERGVGGGNVGRHCSWYRCSRYRRSKTGFFHRPSPEAGQRNHDGNEADDDESRKAQSTERCRIKSQEEKGKDGEERRP